MRRMHSIALVGALASIATPCAAQLFNGGIPAGFTCAGACGTSAAVGDITLAPGGGTRFGYVSTFNGLGPGFPGAPSPTPNPADLLGVANTTNGSLLTSAPFTATAGQLLSFAFNFLSTDGTDVFPDYGFVRLIGAGSPIVLFTAQTNPTPGGNMVPGFALPSIAPGVTLSPASTPVIPGSGFDGGPVATNAILGPANGGCFGDGCGLSKWVVARYTVATAGTYQLQFGVSNILDDLFDTALAFDFGAGIGAVPTAPGAGPGAVAPEPSTYALVAGGLLALAAARRRRRRP
jgi:hypothetical protein